MNFLSSIGKGVQRDISRLLDSEKQTCIVTKKAHSILCKMKGMIAGRNSVGSNIPTTKNSSGYSSLWWGRVAFLGGLFGAMGGLVASLVFRSSPSLSIPDDPIFKQLKRLDEIENAIGKGARFAIFPSLIVALVGIGLWRRGTGKELQELPSLLEKELVPKYKAIFTGLKTDDNKTTVQNKIRNGLKKAYTSHGLTDSLRKSILSQAAKGSISKKL